MLSAMQTHLCIPIENVSINIAHSILTDADRTHQTPPLPLTLCRVVGSASIPVDSLNQIFTCGSSRLFPRKQPRFWRGNSWFWRGKTSRILQWRDKESHPVSSNGVPGKVLPALVSARARIYRVPATVEGRTCALVWQASHLRYTQRTLWILISEHYGMEVKAIPPF